MQALKLFCLLPMPPDASRWPPTSLKVPRTLGEPLPDASRCSSISIGNTSPRQKNAQWDLGITDIIILTKNNFTFQDRNVPQVQSTAMGTKMAPSYANLFMSDLEDRLLSSAPHRPLVWWRFIDDSAFGVVTKIA